MPDSKIIWSLKHFHELTTMELYDLLTLRINVFVVEQNCPYPETDGKDKVCHHIMGTLDGKVIACARIVPPGYSYEEVSLGRVATDKEYRKGGHGIELMKEVMKGIDQLYGKVPIRISAQSYLLGFYGLFGFNPVGDEYLEDDIPHTEMVK